MADAPHRARPNVLMIVTDDQGFWALGCAGNAELRTPNLDRLAAGGVRLDRLFCVTPVCSAARASILTGRIASRHGVHDFLRSRDDAHPLHGGDTAFLDGQPTYTQLLAGAGYECGISGKWHLGADHRRQAGMAFWRVKGGAYMDCPFHDETGGQRVAPGYVTDAITAHALAFLDARAADGRPFCLNVHYNAPHSPWRREHHPPELFDPYFENCPFESVPLEPKHPDDVGITDFFHCPERRREKLSGYYAAVTGLDAGVGRLLDRLEGLGLARETLVIFTSDNGMNMGHHGICGKGNGTSPLNLFETSVRVPGIVRWPGRWDDGSVCGELLSHYDILPTLLELTGLEHPDPDSLPGRGVAEVLEGKDAGAGSVVVFDEYGPARMIRTERWKYTHRYPQGPHELYDLDADPDECRNLLADRGEKPPEAAELRAEMEAWFDRYATRECDGRGLGVTGCGQFAPPGEPGAFAQSFPESWLFQPGKG